MRLQDKKQKETEFERNLNELALVCQGEKDKPEFLKPFFEKMFVRFDSRLGAAILQEIIYRAIIGKELDAPIIIIPVKESPRPNVTRPNVTRKTIRETERKACRQSIRGDCVTDARDPYWSGSGTK